MSQFSEIAPRIRAGTATPDELAKLKIEDVVAIKSDPDHIIRRICSKARPRTIDAVARTIEWLASDETVDRAGDIIRVKGWSHDEWDNNPLILRNHDYDAPPLGLGTKAYKGKTGEDLPGFFVQGTIHGEDLLDETGRAYARQVLAGVMRASSVGFMPVSTTRPDSAEERQSLGLGPWGVVYEKASLLEHSVVTVPANPNALARHVEEMHERGQINRALLLDVLREIFASNDKRFAINIPAIDFAPVIKSTLDAALPAIKAQLESVTRGAAAQSPAQRVEHEPKSAPAPVEELDHLGAAKSAVALLMDSVDRQLAAKKLKTKEGA